MVCSLLKLTILVLGTKHTPVLDGNMAKTDVHGAAAITAITGETCIGMPPEDIGDMFPAQLLDLRAIGLHHHPIRRRRMTGQYNLPTDLNQA